MALVTWLHWYMAAFFALFGAALLAWGRHFACIGPLIRRPCGDSPDAQRLCAAIERREALEALPGAAMGRWSGGASLAAALLAACTPVPPTLLYAIVCVVLALTFASAYLRLRRAGARRVASLRARSRAKTVPAWLTALVAVAAVSPLTFLGDAPLAAALVTAAGLLIAFLGDRVVHLPALLGGNDPAVDEYVDDRLRAVRSTNLFATATAPAFVFATITATLLRVQDGSDPLSSLHLGAMGVSFLAWIVASAWQYVQMRRGPNAADVARWAQNGV
jgi:hypothetical protein